jgi:thioredoxin-like negative regulator of GroEL
MPAIITSIESKDAFFELQRTNPGLLIIKFGAEWCKPCKLIEKDIHYVFSRMPENVQTAIIDVDESFEIYGFLKSKRVLNGIPVVICYKQGNLELVPDDIVVGADNGQLIAFFERIMKPFK